jgi:hypothetical protein
LFSTQVWALPGKFVTDDLDTSVLRTVAEGARLAGELPSSESPLESDQARLIVRQIFELEGIPSGKEAEVQDLFDELFKKASQNMIYRGYCDDPRNTDTAWVETSAWHVHCPSELAGDLTAFYEDASQEVTWMNIIVNGDRLEFEGADGVKYDLFASHRELIEMAVFDNVLGNPDMWVIRAPPLVSCIGGTL